MGNFTGNLNSNKIFAALYNQIISQQVFADNIKGTNQALVDEARTDGTLYGDKKLYYATDVLKSADWGNDAEAANLLALHRPPAPEVQEITLDKFRQICLTVDNYLTKQAYNTEGAFSSFNSVMTQWMQDTKRIYDSTTFNAYFGTAKSQATKNTVTIDLAAVESITDPEQKARVEAQTIAKAVADLMVDMTDISRDYNDYGFLRSYNESDIKIVWNADWLNKIAKIDLPTIFHKDGLLDKFDKKLPSRYFGDVNTSSGTTSASNTTVRSLIEKDYGSGSNVVHVFAGDLIPNSTTYAANETYTVNSKVMAKIYVKLPPYMSAFEVGTDFFNAKSLTENRYLTFGHNTIEYLYNFPFITLEKA